jgi:hypothetical protein
VDLTKGIPVAIRLKTEVTQNNELQEFLYELS